MARVSLIIACVAVLALIGVAAFLKVSLDDANKELTDLRGRHQDDVDAWEAERLRTAAASAEQGDRIEELEKIEREGGRLQARIEGLQKELTEKDTTLEAERQKVSTLTGRVATLTSERDSAQEALKEQRQVHDELAPKLSEAKEAKEKLTQELEALRDEKAALEGELATALAKNEEITKEIKRLRVLAPDAAGTRIVGKVEEKVPPRKIIISELSAPPEVDLEFSVFRGPEFIARARVYRVFEKYAGARLTFIQQGKEVRPGDTVKTGF
jgi:chromosome segregation ATPase